MIDHTNGVYEFTPPDAGTFWYHPHVNGSEQQGRGLYGALIVEEAEPPDVDRDLTWALDDWRLSQDASRLRFLRIRLAIAFL